MRPRYACLFGLLLCLPIFFAGVLPGHASTWSDTTPELNLSHIFDGEINRHGKPVGFHVRLDNQDPAFSRLKEILKGPNKHGVYTGIAEIFDPKAKIWKEKFSSFFPARLKRSEIIDLIIQTWKKRKKSGSAKWRAASGLNFAIEGYTTSRGGIITAYPIYVETD